MDFAYTREQEVLRNVVREFAEKEVAPRAAEFDRTGEFDYEIISKMAKMKLLGVVIPKEYGGQGASHIDQAIICEEMARAYSAASILTNTAWLVAYSLAKTGTEDNKERWIRYLFDGKKLGAHAGTEPDAGTDAASMRTWAKPDGDGWVIDGTKTFVSNFTAADYYCVAVRTSPSRYGGLSTVIVEKGTPGVHLGRRFDLTSNRAIINGEMRFENCKVPYENLVGKLNNGFHDMMMLYDVLRCYLAIVAVGTALAALDASMKFAQGREQFGKPVADFQLVRAMLVDMATEIDAARFLTYRALDMDERGLPHTKETSMAKLYATEMAERATHKAIQIHGGYGITKDYPVERYWRDTRLLTIGEGTSEIQRLIISAAMLKSEKIVMDSALD